MAGKLEFLTTANQQLMTANCNMANETGSTYFAKKYDNW